MRVLTAAQKAVFEEELGVVEAVMKEQDRIRIDCHCLKGLEAG